MGTVDPSASSNFGGHEIAGLGLVFFPRRWSFSGMVLLTPVDFRRFIVGGEEYIESQGLAASW